MEYLITPEEVGVLSRPISQHIDHQQITAYITEVEQLIIRPKLGDFLFGEVKKNPTDYHVILEGGSDDYGQVCGGLKKALAYYTYARIVKDGATIATRFGAVEKTDEYSMRIEQDRKDAIYRECTQMADAYLEEVVKYSKKQGWVSDSEAGGIRSTVYIIGE